MLKFRVRRPQKRKINPGKIPHLVGQWDYFKDIYVDDKNNPQILEVWQNTTQLFIARIFPESAGRLAVKSGRMASLKCWLDKAKGCLDRLMDPWGYFQKSVSFQLVKWPKNWSHWSHWWGVGVIQHVRVWTRPKKKKKQENGSSDSMPNEVINLHVAGAPGSQVTWSTQGLSTISP